MAFAHSTTANRPETPYAADLAFHGQFSYFKGDLAQHVDPTTVSAIFKETLREMQETQKLPKERGDKTPIASCPIAGPTLADPTLKSPITLIFNRCIYCETSLRKPTDSITQGSRFICDHFEKGSSSVAHSCSEVPVTKFEAEFDLLFKTRYLSNELTKVRESFSKIPLTDKEHTAIDKLLVYCLSHKSLYPGIKHVERGVINEALKALPDTQHFTNPLWGDSMISQQILALLIEINRAPTN